MKTRHCPNCSKIIEYKHPCGFYTARKKNSLCASCATFKWQKETGYDNSGEKNPFFGKTHSAATKKKLSKIHKERTNKPDAKCKSKKHREKLSKLSSGQNNPMFGRSVYSVWVKKYGIKEADKRMSACKAKHSKNNTGKGNPMYGKLPPMGAGYGWKGWYKGWFFRSLRELSYMIEVIEKNKYTWVSAETNELSIHYVDCRGHERTYRADFLINGNTLVEVKPKRLHNSPTVQAKMSGAKKFCKKHKLKYELVDCKVLSDKKIRELVDSEKIKFTDRYKKMYEENIDENFNYTCRCIRSRQKYISRKD